MTLRRRAVLCALLFCSAPCAIAALPAPLAQALSDAGLPETAVSVVVQSLNEPEPGVLHRADAPMNPASVMKLLTTYAGLELLGPAYTWKTEAYATGPVHDGVLRGDLYLKGYGDPKLTIEQFWLFLKRIRAAGIREVTGDVILDVGYFAPAAFDPGMFDDKPYRAYNAGPGALLINFNAVNVNLSADETGQGVRAWVEPGFGALRLTNRLKLDNGACGDWREAIAVKVDGGAGARNVELSGRFPASCGEKNYPLSFFGHLDFARGLFLDLWHEIGNKLRGHVRTGDVPAEARRLARIDSPAFSEVIRDMNKWSNNVIARQLYLTLGAESAGAPATLDKSFAAITGWLAAKGMDFPELVLENGSGLSRRDRISARHLADLLLAAGRGPTMPEFVASLPIAAVDGTAQKRFKNDGLAGLAHVKTGTLNGVRALAGFVLDRAGRLNVVVLLINHERAGLASAAEDALLLWVYDGAR